MPDNPQLGKLEFKYKTIIEDFKNWEQNIYQNWFNNANKLVEQFENETLIVYVKNSKKIKLNFFDQVSIRQNMFESIITSLFFSLL
jgi:hypothetical protein